MKRVISILVVVLILISCVGCDPSSGINSDMSKTASKYGITDENYPRIDGSTSTLPLVELIYDKMYIEEGKINKYPKKASKTYPSYMKLIEGEVDMILVPSASEDVLNIAKEKDVELEFIPIIAEALIFITADENTAKDITIDQIRDIYINLGIKNWSELGGEDGILTPIARNEDSGSQAQMKNMVLKNDKMHDTIINNHIELDMNGMLFQAASYQNGGDFENYHPTKNYAIGYTLYEFYKKEDEFFGIGDSLSIFSIDGIKPNEETIKNREYPFVDAYYAVIRKDLPEDHSARSIIQWLKSENGSDVLTDRKYTVID